MSPMAWFYIITLQLSALLAGSLIWVALGTAFQRGGIKVLNLSFSAFAFGLMGLSFFRMLRLITLHFHVGNPALMSELAILFQCLMSPLLFWFSTWYLGRRTRWTDGAVALGVAGLAIASVPLFQHRLFPPPSLDANGLVRVTANVWGIALAQVVTLYNIWAMVLFWQERRRTREPYLALGVLILIIGPSVEPFLPTALPISPVTYVVSAGLLGHGLVSQQIFNPLRELNAELERKVAERTAELQRAYAEIEQRVAERTADLRRSEERFRAIYEGSNDALMLLTREGFFDCNSRALEMFGIPTKEEFTRLNPAHLSPDYQPDGRDSLSATMEWIETAYRDGACRFEWVHRRRDGGEFPADVLLSAFDLGEERVLQATVRDITEQKAAALREEEAEMDRLRLQQEIIEAQRLALRELAAPIIPVTQGVVVTPLVGSIDSLRARDIMRALLAGVRSYRADIVILDITGVPVVDSGVASYLNKAIQAIRLKGAQTIITGISEEVAETIVDLGIDWSQVETLADLESGLWTALNRLGRQMFT